MAVLDVPDSGLSLCHHPRDADSGTPTQFMRLDLAQNTLDDLIQTLRNDQPARIRLGKHSSLFYGSHSKSFRSSPESHPSEIYCPDKENLYFSGILSHSLEVQKAAEATSSADQALATLEQSLNAFERGKEEKQTHLITDSEIRALNPRDRKHAALPGKRPTSKAALEKDRLLKSTASRSVSSSPSLAATRSPTHVPSVIPTSAPPAQNKDRLRLDALKVPFIHLLAIRPVSAKFLAEQTRSNVEDCLTLARKYGAENRDHRDRFDLRDKAYRDLDVWKFPYPSQDDRDQAVMNAISAFDRMRLSRSDNLWQMLLPKGERGKGTCMSRLDLRTGPIKKPLTPRVQAPEDPAKDGYSTGHETDRPGNGRTPKSAEAPRPAPTKRDEKDASKRTKSKNNSTLTGRVTKKTERKPAPKADGKVKSSEYVHDSDDDLDIPVDKPKQESKRPPEDKTGIQKTSRVPTPKIDKEPRKVEAPKGGLSNGVGSKRPPSNASSPQKPSPLGSPPANASDQGKRSSTSSSSSQPKPKQTPANASIANGVKPDGGSLKRKAETERPAVSNTQPRVNGLEHKRQRGVSTSSGSSDGASPALGREILFQQLREKSQKFKRNYSKYRALHDAMAAHSDPPLAELERLERQHAHLQRMKKEIWDEDRRLRGIDTV